MDALPGATISPSLGPARPCIDVVDDDPDFRSVLAVLLRSRYDVLSYASAEHWLDAERTQATAPALLITDVNMPGLNGFRLCETARARPRCASLPILFLTGVDSQDGFLHGREAGASAYLTKPVDCAVLLAKIESLLAPKR